MQEKEDEMNKTEEDPLDTRKEEWDGLTIIRRSKAPSTLTPQRPRKRRERKKNWDQAERSRIEVK